MGRLQLCLVVLIWWSLSSSGDCGGRRYSEEPRPIEAALQSRYCCIEALAYLCPANRTGTCAQLAQSLLWLWSALSALAALQGTVDAMWEVLRGFLESPDMRKAWHNYSFDRHVLGNIRAGGRPIQAAGFHADTMHMARLWDSSRKGKGYSLEALSG